MAKNAKDKYIELHLNVLLSVQRALLGEVVPWMRTISVEWAGKQIKIWVYHDGLIEEKDKEDFDACVITQLVADFPIPSEGGPAFALEFVRTDFPEKCIARGQLVYARKEFWY